MAGAGAEARCPADDAEGKDDYGVYEGIAVYSYFKFRSRKK
jgi:hypothetical protein